MTILSAAPSVFESFNARNLDPTQVAQRFIPPQQFNELILRNHGIVVGPRGSGKTTLLKMLQLPALASWNHPAADGYREKIDFIGVFVAADISWGAQLTALGEERLSEDVRTILGFSAFTTHILSAVVRAMIETMSPAVAKVPSLARLHVKLEREEISALSRSLAMQWELTTELPTLGAVQAALQGRLLRIAQIANKLAMAGVDRLNPESSDTSFLFLSPLSAVSYGVEQFNAVADQPYRKWALLFDELEIAPQPIRQALLQALRSTNQNLLFKLSLSPYHEDADLLNKAVSAMPSQDYQPIELWYARKEQGFQFSRSLLEAMIDDAGCSDARPEDIFGSASVDMVEQSRDVHASAYKAGSDLQMRYKRLAARDPSFARYLSVNDVDLEAMDTLPSSVRASIVRKVTSIVATRETFRSEEQSIGGGKRLGRSRKNPNIYYGVEAMLAIVEGNPRWLIGLMGPLIRRYVEDRRRVPRETQAFAISTAAHRFRALLKTIPYVPDGSNTFRQRQVTSRGLLSLLDAIGDRFFRHIVIDDFTPDPVLSFTIDANTSEAMIEALGKALNAGAIILVPDSGAEAIASSIKGKRFRLSYMLATSYRLPLLLGREGSLHRLLVDERNNPTPLFRDDI
ncbi:ORC-CDC6 family AAA ATPase [Sphingomonas sp. CFBP 8760]|uniref:ORC-CDC6 family AAA ATPase n=1 Tax=Sphingomonas sp. CFBP 8760 TaxID=2775282 RepID=UPI0017847F12|nr:hypothetical protein [Sphingomonas sp. CFBP 8760]MBD8546841.1 hypothetical protein [Sphingomonas sp. CFBP 8760]